MAACCAGCHRPCCREPRLLAPSGKICHFATGQDPVPVIVGIWQMGFSENAAARGASPSTDVADCVNKFISAGNQATRLPSPHCKCCA